MRPLLIHPTNWTDYSLIDSGDGKKLEKFGPYTFSRPEPQAIWQPRLKVKIWENFIFVFSAIINKIAVIVLIIKR